MLWLVELVFVRKGGRLDSEKELRSAKVKGASVTSSNAEGMGRKARSDREGEMWACPSQSLGSGYPLYSSLVPRCGVPLLSVTRNADHVQDHKLRA